MTEASNSSNTIQLNDLFWTLQGEGRWSGHRALFVRMPFCNYNCPWCDTEYNSFKKWSTDEFENFCDREPAKFAVLTGGEPLAHKHTAQILQILKSKGFYIACETNGSYPIPESIDFPTVSPKAFTQEKFPAHFIDPQALQVAKEFKYVVDDNFNFEILKAHQPFNKATIYSLSPEYSKMQKNLIKIMEYIQENPQWKLSLQTHKWLDIP